MAKKQYITDGTALFELEDTRATIIEETGSSGSLWNLERDTTYSVGDIAYTSNLPSYLRLECVVPGTTGTTEPDFSGVSTGGV